MPPKSKKNKIPTESSPKAGPSRESVDHEERSDEEQIDLGKFAILPLNVFRELTNIRELVINDLRAKSGKNPMEIEIQKEIQKRHGQMKDSDKWKKLNCHQLRWLDSPIEYVSFACFTPYFTYFCI